MPPRPKKEHNDYRACVCLLCFGKTKEMRKISVEQMQVIDQYFVSGLDLSNDLLPTALCSNCRLIVQEKKANPEKDVSSFQVFDHSLLISSKPLTRLSPNCTCIVCEVGSKRFFCQNQKSQQNKQRGDLQKFYKQYLKSYQ